mmetsp:Transcript_16324/g.32868  ORF Transcript_16324/g.32868 Transcript_16324/m.32868 type:complete len:94 (-) Transcript_16324:45-326(-)
MLKLGIGRVTLNVLFQSVVVNTIINNGQQIDILGGDHVFQKDRGTVYVQTDAGAPFVVYLGDDFLDGRITGDSGRTHYEKGLLSRWMDGDAVG